jgi:hypothetical protein
MGMMVQAARTRHDSAKARPCLDGSTT